MWFPPAVSVHGGFSFQHGCQWPSLSGGLGACAREVLGSGTLCACAREVLGDCWVAAFARVREVGCDGRKGKRCGGGRLV